MKVNIFILVTALILGALAYGAFKPRTTEEVQQDTVKTVEPPTPEVSDISTYELWQLVNDYRESKNTKPLSLNKLLEDSATTKCEDLADTGVWSHKSKNGVSFNYGELIEASGYDYFKAGENLAYGYESANEVLAGWKSSEAHNANILDNEFTEVGFSVCFAEEINKDLDQLIVVQHLATR